MVVFFTSTAVSPPATLYMGKDKFENETLLKYGDEQDVWFHADKLSSAHVYLRLPDDGSYGWQNIPAPLVEDAAQLTKANSIQGNKEKNVAIIYTPWSNIKKQGDMAIGAVSFHNDQRVRRTNVKDRENAVVNRLNKTKRVEDVDHEAVRQERLRKAGRIKKDAAVKSKNEELAAKRAWQADKEARDYSTIFSPEAMAEAEEEQRRREKLKALTQEEGGDDASDKTGEESDDSFM